MCKGSGEKLELMFECVTFRVRNGIQVVVERYMSDLKRMMSCKYAKKTKVYVFRIYFNSIYAVNEPHSTVLF